MGIYDSIMRRDRQQGTTLPPDEGGATVLPDMAATDPRPQMTPDLYQQLWPTGDTTTTSSSSSSTGTIGSGKFAGKPLPLDEPQGAAGKIVNAAKALIGTPYVWGGTSGSGVDCSGLVFLAYKAAGIKMPRLSADQAREGQRIALKDLQPGDLVAWDLNDRNVGADHIAIYIGGGHIIEAPEPGQDVHITSLYRQNQAWGVRLGSQ